ncbi:hypothetical protein KR222_005651 [Zaprionus bogoriensis]|nr:hypothetical protein KR222_005651 [Zaprionus bogoriensis]
MNQAGLKLLLICSLCLRGCHFQFVDYYKQLASNELEYKNDAPPGDELDLSRVNWRLVIPLLLKREQLRLCLAVTRHDQRLVAGTPCERLLGSGLMAYCDIGSIEDISMTMRRAFGAMLFDTLQKCRPGLELFGVRCRRRA